MAAIPANQALMDQGGLDLGELLRGQPVLGGAWWPSLPGLHAHDIELVALDMPQDHAGLPDAEAQTFSKFAVHESGPDREGTMRGPFDSVEDAMALVGPRWRAAPFLGEAFATRAQIVGAHLAAAARA